MWMFDIWSFLLGALAYPFFVCCWVGARVIWSADEGEEEE